MYVFKGERGHRTTSVPSRKLWHALHEVDNYLRGQSIRLVNYAERYRAGLRVGTSVTEGVGLQPAIGEGGVIPQTLDAPDAGCFPD